MPRNVLGLIQTKVFISPSQEAIFETIPGWDDVQQAGRVIDDTPSQPAYPDNSSQNSLQRVFDVTGSSLSEASQEAVEWASPETSSPRATSDAAAAKEDSYNEAFESDRSRSPSRALSWTLGHACKHPKSPTSTSVPEEIERPPVNLETMSSRVGMLNRPIAPAEGDAVAEDVEHRCGRVSEIDKGNPAIDKGDDGAQTSAEFQAMPPSPNRILSSPRRSFAPLDGQVLKPSVASRESTGEDFGSGSASAFITLKGKESDGRPSLSRDCPVPPQSEDGLVDEASVTAADQDATVLDASSVGQNKLDTLGNTVNGKDCSEAGQSSPPKAVQDDKLNNLEDVDRKGVGGDTEHIPVQDKLEIGRAAVRRVGGLHVETPSATDESRDEGGCAQPLFSPASLKALMDAVRKRSAENTGAPVAPLNSGQHSPPSPPRPPRAVQEKLDKLRSHSGKRVCRDNSDTVRDGLSKDGDRFHESRHFRPATVLDAIRLRAASKPAPTVTAAELLDTALRTGVSLPAPFHRNYFHR